MNVSCLTLCNFIIALSFSVSAQSNFVGNPSFEDDCTQGIPIFWPGVDSMKCNGGSFQSECPNNGGAPLNPFGYQKARTGAGYMLCTFFISNGDRGYLRNRMKAPLLTGKSYCARFFVNISNNSTCSIDAIGGYFATKQMDTITGCPWDLSYLSPQISNASGNYLSDTLLWTAIQGTFTAVGGECYMVIGNFKSNQMTNYQVISTNPPFPLLGTDVCIDDVSCVPLDMPAFAGADKRCIVGDSVFIGRPSDVGIDYACQWFKLPNLATPIATVTGLWVKPSSTSTYVVRQQLWCSGVQWDTVVVYKDALGLQNLKNNSGELKIFPSPANEYLEINISQEELFQDFKKIIVFNNLGLIMREEELIFAENKFILKTADLPQGIYSFQLQSDKLETVSSRFVITR